MNGGKQRCALVLGRFELHFSRQLHLAPSSNMFRTLDKALDCFSTHEANCPDVVRRRSEGTIPEFLLDCRKVLEQQPCRGSFQDFDGIGDGNRRRQAEKQMHVIGLNLQRPNSPLAFIADFIEQFSQSGYDTPRQNRFAVFRTPHHVVCSLVDRIAITNEFHCHHMVAQKRLLPQLKLGVSGARKGL
jgi:hypothetical protein